MGGRLLEGPTMVGRALDWRGELGRWLAETPGLRISRSEGAIDARISHRRSCGLGRPPEFTAKISIVNFDLCSTTLTGEVRMVAQPADGLLILMATAKARNANTGVLE
jgi:hypothetical protein